MFSSDICRNFSECGGLKYVGAIPKGNEIFWIISYFQKWCSVQSLCVFGLQGCYARLRIIELTDSLDRYEVIM